MTKKIILIFLLFIFFISLAYANDNPQEWAHGWMTNDVITTRYKTIEGCDQMSSLQFPYTIGFKFPRNPNNCDRSELSDFIEKNGGFILGMGGYPGAEIQVFFKDVNNKETANKKIKAILPQLSRLIRSLK